MAITKDDLLLFRQDKEVELSKSVADEEANIQEIERKIEAMRNDFYRDHNATIVKKKEKLITELELLENLIKKADADSEVL